MRLLLLSCLLLYQLVCFANAQKEEGLIDGDGVLAASECVGVVGQVGHDGEQRKERFVDDNTTGFQTGVVEENDSKKKNTLADGAVHQLGLENFASVIGSSSYTLVLFNDRTDLSPKVIHQRVTLRRLSRVYSEMKQPSAFFLKNLRVSFAELDTRRHGHLRRVYSPKSSKRGVGKAYRDFYQNFDDLDEQWDPIPHKMVNSTTFMSKPSHELPKFPSFWMLFHGDDFNVVDYFKDDKETNETNPLSASEQAYNSVKDWLAFEIKDSLHFTMQGVGEPRLQFKGSSNGPPAAIKSQINIEKGLEKKYEKSNPMDSIDWEAANYMKRNNSNKESGPSFDPDLFAIEEDERGETFHKFVSKAKIGAEVDAVIMDKLSNLIDTYLIWVDGYENLWDEDRKAREDERTNFGYYLEKMNREMKDMIFSIFDDLEDEVYALNPLVQPSDIPDLKNYFADMVFGYGRSPSALNRYLKEVVYNKKVEDGTEGGIELFERIREYMRVREQVGADGKRDMYNMYFNTIWAKWFAILADFHTNLTRHYLAYLEANPAEKQDQYQFKKVDIIDMKDPKNFELLSNYDIFESQYVEQRKPFILANAGLTEPFNYTLDFLVEKCGFMDVTDSVLKSFRVGDESVNSWGGLREFVLPKQLMTEQRKKPADKEDDDDDDDDGWDKDLSLQQFIALTEIFDYIYLHDFCLMDSCNSLLATQTLYDPPENQYFRIPSVIGRYDLFQKVPKSSYMHSWPSLFIGRKGTNSKLHVDSGATGFWMYLVSGKKRWVMFDPAERPFLYEYIDRHSFLADVLALNSTTDESERKLIEDYFAATYPLLSRATTESKGYEIVQEAGQLLYIPPGTPHAVENLEDIVGISMNQVPRAGVSHHLHNLIHDKRNFGQLEIMLRYLMSEENGRDKLADVVNPLYTTLGEYISQA